jgi:predicted transcriptional regulator of viral defense system
MAGGMRKNYHFKTLGPEAAKLVTTLHEKGRTIFSIHDIQKITSLEPKLARNFADDLVKRAIATRLKPGLFNLVPFELGQEREYVSNPYLIARELAGQRPYFLAHASAMYVHQMLTQPQLVVYVTTPEAVRDQTIRGTEFRFVRCKPEDVFGSMEHWIDKTQKVIVSDLERTVIDGLKQPKYCGGFSEVAKGFWIRHRDIDIPRLVDYALRLDIGAVIRRLGFLLELSKIERPIELERLRRRLTDAYDLLDPTLPAEGKRLARWRIRVNVTPEEIEAGRST